MACACSAFANACSAAPVSTISNSVRATSGNVKDKSRSVFRNSSRSRSASKRIFSGSGNSLAIYHQLVYRLASSRRSCPWPVPRRAGKHAVTVERPADLAPEVHGRISTEMSSCVFSGYAYASRGDPSGGARTFGLAALMALVKGRSRLPRKRRLVVCLSVLARSPLRCDIGFSLRLRLQPS